MQDLMTDFEKRCFTQALRELQIEGVVARSPIRKFEPLRGDATIIPFPLNRVSRRRLGEPPEAA